MTDRGLVTGAAKRVFVVLYFTAEGTLEGAWGPSSAVQELISGGELDRYRFEEKREETRVSGFSR